MAFDGSVARFADISRRVPALDGAAVATKVLSDGCNAYPWLHSGFGIVLSWSSVVQSKLLSGLAGQQRASYALWPNLLLGALVLESAHQKLPP